MRHCIDILADELRMTMQLCGIRNIAELSPSLIRRRGQAAGILGRPREQVKTVIRIADPD